MHIDAKIGCRCGQAKTLNQDATVMIEKGARTRMVICWQTWDAEQGPRRMIYPCLGL